MVLKTLPDLDDDFDDMSDEPETQSDALKNILRYLSQGEVIPIISNSFRIEQIFRADKEVTDKISKSAKYDDEDLTIDEQLTKLWAERIKYPMPDTHNLARVAQYHLVESKDQLSARSEYLDFLKRYLLRLARSDNQHRTIALRLLKRVQNLSFSNILHQLDYLNFPEGVEDPLRLLARLPLPIYITTSYYDFLERALELEDKKPRTQVCFWCSAGSNRKNENCPDPTFKPSVDEPAVYHLYGLEDHPQTLVLSEDDYMNFLVSIAEDKNTQNPIVPIILHGALAENRLLLLGYQLRDWDFRILFRFIQHFRENTNSPPRGMVIQLKPDRKRIGEDEKSLSYLSHYFDKKEFDVEWTNTEDFIQELWTEWDKYRRGLQ